MNNLRILRTLLALIIWVGLVALLIDSVAYWGPGTMSLHGYLAWIAQIQWLPALWSATLFGALAALSIFILTALFGRWYCSIICPLGITQDFFIRLGGLKVWRKLGLKPRKFGYTRHRNLRITVAVVFTVLLFVAHPIACIIEPYSLFARCFSVAPFIGVVALICLLAMWKGRWWCNNICPVGAALGLASAKTLFGIRIDSEKCIGCGLCARGCKGECIDVKNHTVNATRCVDCFDCIDACHSGAISYSLSHTSSAKSKETASSPGRRSFVTTLGLVGISAAVRAQQVKTDGGLAVLLDKKTPVRTTPVLPAGAQSVRHFHQHCTSCLLCVSACPQQILRPRTDLDNFLQPELHFDRGYCLTNCTYCQDVCPAGAILHVPKTTTKTGTAVYIADNCVKHTDGVACDNCVRHCPTGALLSVEGGIAVDAERCIGCGRCEHICPARPFSAIYVEGIEHQREI